MTKTSLSIVLVALLSLAFLPCRVYADAPATTQAGQSKAFLWHVKDAQGKNVATLVGSVHLATDDFYPLPDLFYDAFEKADALVVEVDMSKLDQNTFQASLLRKGMYQAPDALSKHVSKETLDAVNAYGKLPPVLTERMKPWLLATMVTMQELQEIGYKPELGIDQHFLAKAKDTGKKVLELESSKAQLDLLSGFDAKLQEQFLIGTLRDIKTLGSSMEVVDKAWLGGDAQTLDQELIQKSIERTPEIKPVMKKMFDDRNLAMSERIDRMIKNGGKPFVVVGAGHLVGEKGIIKLMGAQGYTLSQGTYTPAANATTAPASTSPRSALAEPLAR